MSRRFSSALCIAVLMSALASAGCDGGASSAAASTADAAADTAVTQPVGVVDSIRTVKEDLRRFRATLVTHPAGLEEGAETRDELVQRFVRAVAARDTAELRALLLTRSEFAYSYYPESRFTKRPYQLPPDIVWMQLEHATASGIARALKRLGGKPLELQECTCPHAAAVEGVNRLWHECTVRIGFPDAQPVRLFGSILERDGRFKFVSYANAL